MAGIKQIFLLIIQGFYLGCLCQQWTFPSEITALIGSCVDIPCTYHPAGRSGESSTVWYLYKKWGYPEILNTKDAATVMKEYKDRTSLVQGNNSCTLRIDPVRRDDKNYYYPGIAEFKNTNAYDEQSRTLNLDVTDTPADLRFYMSSAIREEVVTTYRCTAYHTCRSRPPSLQWNKPGQIELLRVFSEGSWREESHLTYIPSYVDDGSVIQCTATYPNGQKIVKSSTMSFMYSPQNVTVTIIGNDELMEGNDVTLQCDSFAKPYIYRYEWYKGKEKTRLPDMRRKITVRKVTRDMEPYSCAAINHMGRGESALMEIPVNSPQSVTVTVIGNDELMEGNDVTLQCDSFSNPDVYEYEWYKGENKTKLLDIGREITVKNVTRDVEPYSCAAINQMGRGESALVEVPVLYAATGVQIIVNNDGQVTQLICDFLSSQPNVTHFSWMKDGSILQNQTGKTLTIDSNVETSGQYSCIAHNMVGNASSDEIYVKLSFFYLIPEVIIVLYVSFFARKRRQKVKSSKPAESPEVTYCNLIKKNIENEYEQIRIGKSSHMTNKGRHEGAMNEYLES
ncbi:B-cell receptor CD22-like [Anomaloglossus baeobatrachus]